jgi:hypothetical protein
MTSRNEIGDAFAGWAEEHSGIAVDENFEYTIRTVVNLAAAAFAAGAQWQQEHATREATTLTDVQIQRALDVVRAHRQVEGKHLPYRCTACHEDYGSYVDWLSHVIRLQFQAAPVQDGAA